MTKITLGGDPFDDEKYKDAGKRIVPAGAYNAVLVNVEEKLSKDGLTFLSLTFEIVDEGQCKGWKVFHSLMTDKRYGELSMEISGAFIRNFKKLTGMQDEWEDAFDKVVMLHTKEETKNGVTRAKIRYITAAE